MNFFENGSAGFVADRADVLRRSAVREIVRFVSASSPTRTKSNTAVHPARCTLGSTAIRFPNGALRARLTCAVPGAKNYENPGSLSYSQQRANAAGCNVPVSLPGRWSASTRVSQVGGSPTTCASASARRQTVASPGRRARRMQWVVPPQAGRSSALTALGWHNISHCSVYCYAADKACRDAFPILSDVFPGAPCGPAFRGTWNPRARHGVTGRYLTARTARSLLRQAIRVGKATMLSSKGREANLNHGGSEMPKGQRSTEA